MTGNFWAWVWISVFLGTREFLCFAEKVGLEQGILLPTPKFGTLLIKTFFLLHQSSHYACTQWQVARRQAAPTQDESRRRGLYQVIRSGV